MPRFKCFFKRKTNVRPVVDDGDDISTAGRNKNTANTRLSQDTDSIYSNGGVSCFACFFKLFRKWRRKVLPAEETVSSAERNTNIDSTAEGISTAIKEASISLDSSQVVSEITMPTEDNLKCVFSSNTMENMNISPTEGVTEKMSSPSPESFGEVQKLQGGVVPVGQVERDETSAKGPKTHMNRGLKNFGNSCYINASLQSLFSMERFCTQLCIQLSDWFDHPYAKLIRCFIELWSISEGSDQERKSSLLRNYVSAVASTNPDFTIHTQNDAHEFLFYCLSRMQIICQTLSQARGNASDSPVRANISFQLKNIITCRICGAQKTRNEEFSHLALPLAASNSVENCLNYYLSDEEEIECRCNLCGCRSASRRWAFHTMPRFLVLQLKRFQVSATSIKKQHSRIHIDPVLQLNLPVQSFSGVHAYTMATSTGFQARSLLTGGENKAGEEKKTARKELGESVCTYSLISVLNHVGPSIDSGHFLSDCHNKSDSSWLTYDDENVTLTTVEEVMEQRQRSAYVLFYERS